MIQGVIKANSEGFKNASKQKGIENVILTVKSDKPTKFKNLRLLLILHNLKTQPQHLFQLNK